MKTSSAVICALASTLLLCPGLRAQDTLRPRLGAGISVEPALFGQTLYYVSGINNPNPESASLYFSASPYCIYLPVVLTKNFRIEPRFGIYSVSNEVSNSASPSQSFKDDFTLTNIGLSVEYVFPVGDRFQFYAGPRGSLNFISETSSYYGYTGGSAPAKITNTQTETDFMISGLFGAEYFPLGEMSIGGEIDINYVTFGNPDITQDPPSSGTGLTSTRTRSLVSTGALLFIRWYFL